MSNNAQKVQAYFENRQRGDAKTWTPQILGDWQAYVDGLPDPEWLLEGLWLPDANIIISGPATRAFKTWFCFLGAMVVASGRPAGALKPGNGPVPVLFIEEEGPTKPTAFRFDALSRGYGIDSRSLQNFYWSHREHVDITNPEWVKRVATFVHNNGIKLVCIDTLAMTMRGDENSAKDINIAMKSLRNFRDTGASVVFIHHTRKSYEGGAEDIDEQIRGSGALAGFYDVHNAFRVQDGSKHVDLTVRSNEFEERYYQATWYIDKVNTSAKLELLESQGGIDPKIVDVCFIQLDSEKAYSVRALGKLWRKSASVTQEIVDKLVEQDRIEIGANGKYRKRG